MAKKTDPESIRYTDKKPFFSAKEIIFRSNGRAKIFTISPKLQLIFLCLVAFAAIWGSYYYHMYHRSDLIVVQKNNELVATRDAYVDLIGDFMTLQSNIADMVKTLDNAKTSELNLGQYQHQASIIEDRIKQITTQVNWINAEQLAEKASMNELSLQRDIAFSERDEARRQLLEMGKLVEDIRRAEDKVLERVSDVAEGEIDKIRDVIGKINIPLKKRGFFLNFAAERSDDPKVWEKYIPTENRYLKDDKIASKINKIYQNVEDVEKFRDKLGYIPLGKPVKSLWVSSPYGRRSDPFKKTKAYHKGVDLVARTGKPIITKAKGTIIRAGGASGYGNLVEVDHGNGFKTKYAHMNKIYVKKGEMVDINDVLGEVGSTGRSTGPHLHYEVLYQNRDVDPMPFIKAKKS